MDNDLISRSALIACIGDVEHDQEDDTIFLTMGQACAIAHKSIVDMVKAAPAVDASTLRPTGRWITDENGVTYCGKCRHIDDYASVHNYCPICGEKMEG